MRTLLLTLCLWSTISIADKNPIIVDPVVNATPPGAKVTAGYFKLVNQTDTEITITGAYSPSIAKIEIHRSFIKDDVAKMEKQESVSVKPGDTIEFAHGGYHLMLMELTQALTTGQIVDIILTTTAGDMMIEMPVQKIGMAVDGVHGNDHSNMSEHANTDEAMNSEEKMEHSHSKKTDDGQQVSSN